MSDIQRMGEWFVSRGLIDQDHLEEALTTQRETRQRLGEILIGRGRITEIDVLACHSWQYKMPIADLTKLKSKPSARSFLRASDAFAHLVLPIRVDAEIFECVIADPIDVRMIDELRRVLRRRIVMSLGAPTALRESICEAYELTPEGRPKPPDAAPAAAKRRHKMTEPQSDRSSLLDLLREVA